MIDIDLDAIRKRDATWRDLQPMRESAGRDRHALLLYIDELELLTEEIAVDVGLIKKVHRERYSVTPEQAATDQQLDALDREWSTECVTNGRKGLGDSRDSQTSGKVPL